MKLLLLIGLLSCSASICAAQEQDLSRAMKRQCLILQLGAEQNKGLSNETLTAYCNCVGDGMDDTTKAMIVQNAGKSPMDPPLQARMNAIGNRCIASMR